MKLTKKEKHKKAFANYGDYLKKHCKKGELIHIILDMYERYAPDIIIEVHLSTRV